MKKEYPGLEAVKISFETRDLVCSSTCVAQYSMYELGTGKEIIGSFYDCWGDERMPVGYSGLSG